MKPKSFDTEKTLQVIAGCFAKNGYEGTSLEDLTRETGLGKQSLYNAYGDKKAMLEKALGCSGKDAKAYAALESTELPLRQRVEGFFEEVLQQSLKKSDPGCLMMNLIMEKGGPRDAAEIAADRWEQMRQKIHRVLETAPSEIPEGQNAEMLSYALMSLLSGLRITLRATKDEEKTRRILNLGLEALL